jgi:hypothetical protein
MAASSGNDLQKQKKHEEIIMPKQKVNLSKTFSIIGSVCKGKKLSTTDQAATRMTLKENNLEENFLLPK